MSDYVTDPELLKQLNAPSAPKEEGYVTDPELLKQLGNPSFTPTSIDNTGAIGAAAELAAPAVTGVGISQPLGVSGQAIADVARPAWELAKETYKGPIGAARAVADTALLAHGLPPVAGGLGAAESLGQKYQAAKEAVQKASEHLSQTPLTTSPVSGAQYPGGVVDYRVMQKAAPEAASILSSVYERGGPNAVKNWLQSAEAQQFMNNPAFRDAAESYVGKIPGLAAQAGKLVKPFAVGAARIAGPAGMAMNLYDAGQLARETQLGERLARGEGQLAEQAYRKMPSQINTPANPMPGTPQFQTLQAQYDQQAQMRAQVKAQARATLQQPPTTQNFMQRMQALSNLFGGATD